MLLIPNVPYGPGVTLNNKNKEEYLDITVNKFRHEEVNGI